MVVGVLWRPRLLARTSHVPAMSLRRYSLRSTSDAKRLRRTLARRTRHSSARFETAARTPRTRRRGDSSSPAPRSDSASCSAPGSSRCPPCSRPRSSPRSRRRGTPGPGRTPALEPRVGNRLRRRGALARRSDCSALRLTSKMVNSALCRKLTAIRRCASGSSRALPVHLAHELVEDPEADEVVPRLGLLEEVHDVSTILACASGSSSQPVLMIRDNSWICAVATKRSIWAPFVAR